MPGREQVRGFFGVRMRAAGWIENHRVNRLLTSSCSTFRAFGPTPDALDRAPLNNGVGQTLASPAIKDKRTTQGESNAKCMLL